jgi:hypothetical protein
VTPMNSRDGASLRGEAIVRAVAVTERKDRE